MYDSAHDALVADVIILTVLVGVYVWGSFALSKVFQKTGAAPWRAWVPVLRTAEVLKLGRYEGWNVVWYFLPLLSLYGLLLWAASVHRINTMFGRSTGMTILAILARPVWASILGFGKAHADAGAAQRGAGAPRTAVVSSTPQPIVSPVTPNAPIRATSGGTPSIISEVPGLTLTPTAPPAASSWVPPVQAGSMASSPHADAPSLGDGILDATVIATTGHVPADEVSPQAEWYLVTPTGQRIALAGTDLVLGRKPSAADGGEPVALPDPTKTLSRVHARLTRDEHGMWSVTDLHATNGVIVVDSAGTETLLSPGARAPVPSTFVLGDLRLTILRSAHSPRR